MAIMITSAEKRNSGSSIRLVTDVAMPEKASLTPTSTLDGAVNSTASTPRSERTNPFETDIEAFPSNSSIDKPCRKSVTLEAKSDCQVWPGKDHWKKQAKQAKMKRSCSPLAKLNRRNKIIAKVLIIALVVSIAVAVGFGVSKPLGASIWGRKGD